MGNKVTLGGDRIGVEGKMQVETKTYERTTVDPGYKWISSMSPGTIVPCYAELRLPGDSSEININADIMTHPTLGPLFNSFKFEVDFFIIPARFFNPRLTMDEVGLGMEIEEVKLPLMAVTADYYDAEDLNPQINSSCILAYFDIRGVGHATDQPVDGRRITRKFQMLKLLSYWEIVKNFYANKQEEIGAVIHNNLQPNNYLDEAGATTAFIQQTTGTDPIELVESETIVTGLPYTVYPQTSAKVLFGTPTVGDFRIAPQSIYFQWGDEQVQGIKLFQNYEVNDVTRVVKFSNLTSQYQTPFSVRLSTFYVDNEADALLETEPQIKTFPLKNIDLMRKQIMRSVDEPTAFTIDGTWAASPDGLQPYNLLYPSTYNEVTEKSIYSIQSSQEGLALKTYLSDVNNNWLNKEWLDGENGVNAITAVQVDAEGKFTMDQLNLQSKLYKMLNAVAVSDGSFRAWQLANYDHEGIRLITTPMYIGSLIKEMAFQEVVSNTGTTEQPLGTLAGRGKFTNKHKGGDRKSVV